MSAVRALSAGWNRFWFRPQSTATVEIFRIAYGLLATAWIASMAPVLNAFYGTGAAVPSGTATPLLGAWSLFALGNGTAVVWAVWALGLLAAAALTLGLRTRLAAVVVLVVLLSFMREASPVFNGGDTLVKVLAFYMVLMPAGSALSIDARRGGHGVWAFPRRAPWALRLAQIQLSVVYLLTVWEKLRGEAWRDGTAVSYAMRIENVNRIASPAWLTDSVALMQIATYGTVVLEVAIALLVWNLRFRPWVLALGVLLHVSIDATLLVGFFGLAMLVLYLAFLPPSTAERLVGRLRRRLERNRNASVPHPPVNAESSVADPEPARTQKVVEAVRDRVTT